MKGILPLFLVIALFFTNCNKDDNSPDGNLSAPCCTFSSPTLNYNPTVGGFDMCTGSSVSTNANGDITSIALQFHSYCNTGDYDWIMGAGINGLGSPIISGQTYNITGGPLANSPWATFEFLDYNCSGAFPQVSYNNASTGNGQVKFNVDFTNNEISGEFTLTGADPLGLLPPKTVVCIFSGLPIQVFSM